MEGEKWYSVKEVAARYGVSCDTVRRRIRAGLLRALLWPRLSGKRKRKYETLSVPHSELIRFERANMTS
jgi:excisionase family DNA binding protein